MGEEALKEGVTNLGFRDQRLAFRWVKENIRAIGGDPDKGSYGPVWLQRATSRYPGGFNTTKRPQRTYDTFSRNVPSREELAGSDSTLDCLRKAPIEEIDIGLRSSGGQSWAPVLDGDFFADYPTNQLANRRFLKIPILIGANTDEGTSVGFTRPNNNDDLRDMEWMMVPSGVKVSTGKTQEELIDGLLELYHDDQTVGIPSLDNWLYVLKPGDPFAEELGFQCLRFNAILGDYLVHYQRRWANKAWAKHGIPAMSIASTSCQMDSHLGLEWDISKSPCQVSFVFHNIDGDGYDPNPFGGTEHIAHAKAMSKTISTAWISFFNDIDPNGESRSDLFDGNE
ncbi:triacylglycerol lipase II precursor [Fusarium beomiforme]|uniref:Triacylglycerol lipase II n=1 Tax=Fusarium beomiforme TaxID=44412 RepID=A0A9P5AKY8_9HYPO|nr:triacylglycerol lipase II precursor [Fusarium beomiforme]